MLDHSRSLRADISWIFCCAALTAFGVAGCSQRPSPVHAPNINAAAAAEKAISLYDANKDGFLDKKELDACPGMLRALQTYDLNSDQKISVDEIAQRIQAWKTAGPAMMSLDCHVTLDGRPLEGATVRFAPEPYLEGSLQPGTGVTDANGKASISLPPEVLPAHLKRIAAMYAGTFKVEITHPTSKIPERYNTRTTLGREVSRQTNSNSYEEFELKSK